MASQRASVSFFGDDRQLSLLIPSIGQGAVGKWLIFTEWFLLLGTQFLWVKENRANVVNKI